MVERTQQLLDRLSAIGASLERTGHALALIGLGSVGEARERLDEYSDLDFFAIVRPGFKQALIEDLSWLEHTCPIAFSFQNTRDGHKVLFTDGMYAEFAVFTPEELGQIPAERGQIVWQAPGFDSTVLTFRPAEPTEDHTVEWLVGEIVTNLYVGLCRLHRGELLSAEHLIQRHAVDRLIELSPHIEPPEPAEVDSFAPERRFEARFRGVAARLPQLMQGYDRSVEAALTMVAFVEQYFPVNAAIKQRILDLCAPSLPSDHMRQGAGPSPRGAASDQDAPSFTPA